VGAVSYFCYKDIFVGKTMLELDKNGVPVEGKTLQILSLAQPR